jgi:hypothetical protein
MVQPVKARSDTEFAMKCRRPRDLAAIRIAPLVKYEDLERGAADPLHWLWHGYIAAGAVTLFTSRWKAGKTTLLSVLLARMGTGGDLAGEPVAASQAAIVSEEAPALWAERGRRLGFSSHLAFLCRPFRGKPSAADWEGLLERLGDALTGEGLKLAVIDPLASLSPAADENNAASILAALAPLQRLTAAGIAVLLLHHPRKEDGEPRGSGALPGFADILIEMTGPMRGQPESRRRALLAASRFTETPAERRIELSADGTTYTLTAAADAESFAGGWPVLRMVLEDARHKLTRREVKAQWPEDHPSPGMTILWEWLVAAVEAGLAVRSGAGRRHDPFRYYLPGREEELREDVLELEDLPPLERLSWTRMARAVLGQRR